MACSEFSIVRQTLRCSRSQKGEQTDEEQKVRHEEGRTAVLSTPARIVRCPQGFAVSHHIRSKELYSKFGEKVVRRAHAAGWIVPIIRRPRYTAWSADSVERFESRLHCGDWPPLLPCEVRCEERRAVRKMGGSL